MDRGKIGQSGIRLSEVKRSYKSEQSESGSLLLILMRTVTVWLLVSAWWNSFLAVFPANIDEIWLYGFMLLFTAGLVILAGLPWKWKLPCLIAYPAALGVLMWKKANLAAALINSLANAYLRIHEEGSDTLMLYDEPAIAGWQTALLAVFFTVPLLWLWVQTLIRNKGKVLAGALLLIPVLIAAVEGYFPPAGACWFLIFCMGMYFAGSGSQSGKSAVCSIVVSFFCMLVLFVLSLAIARPIESVKSVDGGAYRQVRNVLNQSVVQRMENLTGGSNKLQKEEKNKVQTDKSDGPEAETPEYEGETGNDAQESGNPFSVLYNGSPEKFLSGGAENLKVMEGFSPGTGDEITLQVDIRPDSTLYYPLAYGGVYNGYTWDIKTSGDVLYPDYSEYPRNLTRLIALCQEQKIGSIEDASRFIQQEFEENTVYDYRPGPTPDDKDFAEYFLFDNKKGFCVHFATTATLLYRIFGFQARYVQGFAVPASAFKEQEDGTYIAEVTGNMGHAWCETYDEGSWSVKEHTLPYLGDEQEVLPPAAASEENAQNCGKLTGERKALLITAVAAGILMAGFCIFLLQGVLRRNKRHAAGSVYRQGKGILSLYKNLLDIAVFLGMDVKEEAAAETFDALKATLPQFTAEDWEWIQKVVWRTLFDKALPSEKEYKRLYEMTKKLAGEVGNNLMGWKKIVYRYVKCLG